MNRHPSPEAYTRAWAAISAKATRQYREYMQHRRAGRSIAEASGLVGVNRRTGERYEARHRAENGIPSPRPSLERKRNPQPDPLVPGPDGSRGGCGTYLAWRLHQILGERPCPVCLQARYPRLHVLTGGHLADIAAAFDTAA